MDETEALGMIDRLSKVRGKLANIVTKFVPEERYEEVQRAYYAPLMDDASVEEHVGQKAEKNVDVKMEAEDSGERTETVNDSTEGKDSVKKTERVDQLEEGKVKAEVGEGRLAEVRSWIANDMETLKAHVQIKNEPVNNSAKLAKQPEFDDVLMNPDPILKAIRETTKLLAEVPLVFAMRDFSGAEDKREEFEANIKQLEDGLGAQAVTWAEWMMELQDEMMHVLFTVQDAASADW